MMSSMSLVVTVFLLMTAQPGWAQAQAAAPLQAPKTAKTPAQAQAPAPAAAPGGLTVEPLDSSITGLTLTGPDDPAFAGLIAELVPADKMAAVAPYLPQSLILTNHSGQALRALCVVFLHLLPGRRPIQGGYSFSEPSFSKPIMADGERRIFTPNQVVEKLIQGRQLPAKLSSHPSQYDAVSLETVVYFDWRVAGAGAGRHFSNLVSMQRADLVACQQVGPSGTPDAANLALLQQEAAQQVDLNVPVTPERQYTLDLQSSAQRMLNMLGTDIVRNVCAPILSTPNFESLMHR
jgi:hypothetical protein